MTHYILFLVSFLGILFLSSCYPTLYFPDRANTPGFREAKEARLVAAVKVQPSDTTTAGILAPAADAAYAITDHIGIAASYRSLVNKTISEEQYPASLFSKAKDNFGGRYNSHYADISAGWFSTFGRVGQVEVYVGTGFGKVTIPIYTLSYIMRFN